MQIISLYSILALQKQLGDVYLDESYQQHRYHRSEHSIYDKKEEQDS